MALGDALLALLLPGPRHGYDLKRVHDRWFAGLRPIAFGQVYSTLARLQRDNLIQVAKVETAEGPERTTYELTVAGSTRARDWMASTIDPDSTTGAGTDELIRKTLAAYHLRSDMNVVIVRQQAAHLRAIQALELSRASAPHSGENDCPPKVLGMLVASEHRQLHLTADLRWLEIIAERMHRLPPPSVDSLLGPIPDRLGHEVDMLGSLGPGKPVAGSFETH